MTPLSPAERSFLCGLTHALMDLDIDLSSTEYIPVITEPVLKAMSWRSVFDITVRYYSLVENPFLAFLYAVFMPRQLLPFQKMNELAEKIARRDYISIRDDCRLKLFALFVHIETCKRKRIENALAEFEALLGLPSAESGESQDRTGEPDDLRDRTAESDELRDRTEEPDDLRDRNTESDDLRDDN
jgi:hypothetical protein